MGAASWTRMSSAASSGRPQASLAEACVRAWCVLHAGVAEMEAVSCTWLSAAASPGRHQVNLLRLCAVCACQYVHKPPYTALSAPTPIPSALATPAHTPHACTDHLHTPLHTPLHTSLHTSSAHTICMHHRTCPCTHSFTGIFKQADMEEIFEEIDVDGGGSIALGEFEQW